MFQLFYSDIIESVKSILKGSLTDVKNNVSYFKAI